MFSFTTVSLKAGWNKALKSAANENRVVVEASKGIDLMEGLPEEEEEGREHTSRKRHRVIF